MLDGVNLCEIDSNAQEIIARCRSQDSYVSRYLSSPGPSSPRQHLITTYHIVLFAASRGWTYKEERSSR